MNINTKAVQGSRKKHGKFEFPVPSIISNSAVLLDSVEDGWKMLTNESIENIAYQRYANPTVSILEENFSNIEDSKYSLAVNSGMTACYLIFRSFLMAGDHIISQHSLYHEISDQLKIDQKTCGVLYTLIDNYDIKNFEKSIRPTTKMVFVETPTNPAMYDVDIPALAKLCKNNNILLVVDNTLLTPIYQKPLRLGADITIYSTTKSINGHGDALGGIICTNRQLLYQKMKVLRDNTGLIMDPFSAWITLRGLRTLPLRLEKHNKNAQKVIKYLKNKYPRYELLYPTYCLNSKKNKVKDGGGVLSIILSNKKQGLKFISNLKLIRIGTTFGNLESLCYHFGGFARPSRNILNIGIPLGLVRLSIGLENANDIISDIDQALNKSEKYV